MKFEGSKNGCRSNINTPQVDETVFSDTREMVVCRQPQPRWLHPLDSNAGQD
jgi:hypothetical protein